MTRDFPRRAGLCLAAMIFIALFGLVGAGMARAQDAQEFWRVESARRSLHAVPRHARAGKPHRVATAGAAAGSIPSLIAHATAASIGARYAGDMIRIARIESGLRCSPGGNQGGLYQFTRGTRARLGLGNPLSCAANIAAAMRYAATCVAHGARGFAGLARCWNGGSPATPVARLERAYRVALRG
jgi:hypothetical protein